MINRNKKSYTYMGVDVPSHHAIFNIPQTLYAQVNLKRVSNARMQLLKYHKEKKSVIKVFFSCGDILANIQ